jgi:hypothetical protein
VDGRGPDEQAGSGGDAAWHGVECSRRQ